MGQRDIAFLYDRVTGTFKAGRTHGLDRQAGLNVEAIKAKTGIDDSFIDVVGEVLAYTVDLKFHWEGDEPDTILALEEFWSMWKKGIDIGDCMKFYSANVDNLVMVGARERYETTPMTLDALQALLAAAPEELRTALQSQMALQDGVIYTSKLTQPRVLGWHRAMLDSLAAWQPPRAMKLLSQLSPEEQGDPLSSPNTGTPVIDS